MNYILHLLHFLVQRVLLLASQEAIFIKPHFFSHKKLSANSKLGKVELRVVLYGRQNVSNLILKKKLLLLITELVVILKYLDQLYDQLCDPQPPPSAKMNNRSFV